MTFTRRGFLALTALPLASSQAQTASLPLLRKDCFFGLHFDLHPAKTDTALGRDVTDEMVDGLLARVRPDFVQYDCKGHPGYLGFQSTIGTSSPGIVKDSLEIWRRVTKRRGVELYIHFSGIWDSLAVERHPEWARVRPDGKPDDRITSTFGPYEDKLMIPELEEAISRYSLDGAWIDGECWAVAPDYGERVRLAFHDRTGLSDLPVQPEDAGWLEFLDLNREQFRRYVRHYVDELHRLHPGVQLASNWLYSSYVPEQPDIPVDYLSGDFAGATPVSTARLEARYLASTGKPWDLMSWGFVAQGGKHIPKPPKQLKHEAAAVITQGGGYQIYYNPTRAGRIDGGLVDVMEEVARFCRERQELSFHSVAVPQVGVLFSRYSLYTTANRMFGGWGAAVRPVQGAIDSLLAAQYSVEIVPDWKLDDAGRYPLMVVPEWPDIGSAARNALTTYAQNGGSLVIFGAHNAGTFAELTGLRVTGMREQEWVMLGETGFTPIRGLWADVESGSTAQLVEQRFATFDSRKNAVSAAFLASAGKGKVVVVPGPIGAAYANSHAPALHEFLRSVIARVFQPAVEITGPGIIEMSLRSKGERQLLHLTNIPPMQLGPDSR